MILWRQIGHSVDSPELRSAVHAAVEVLSSFFKRQVIGAKSQVRRQTGATGLHNPAVYAAKGGAFRAGVGKG